MWSISCRRFVSVSTLRARRTVFPSLRQLHPPAYAPHRAIQPTFRLQSTSSTTRATSSPSSASLIATVLAASALSGLAGFFYARQKPDVVDTLANPQFGSPEDYKRGIEELRTRLPSEDMVSTNPDDLLAHGISANIWHPGELFYFFRDERQHVC